MEINKDKLSQSKRDSLKHYIKHSIPTDAFHLFQPIRDIIENFFIKNKDEETKIINGIVPKSNNFEKTSSLYIKKACGENHKDIEMRISNHLPILANDLRYSPNYPPSYREYANICILFGLNNSFFQKLEKKNRTIKITSSEYKKFRPYHYWIYRYVTETLNKDSVLLICESMLEWLNNEGFESFKNPLTPEKPFRKNVYSVEFIKDDIHPDRHITTNESQTTELPEEITVCYVDVVDDNNQNKILFNGRFVLKKADETHFIKTEPNNVFPYKDSDYKTKHIKKENTTQHRKLYEKILEELKPIVEKLIKEHLEYSDE